MPGFEFPIIGGSQPSRRRAGVGIEYYYKYTWTIDNLFQGIDPTVPNIADFLDGNSPVLQLKDATLPVFTANKDIVMGGSLEYKFAKSVSFDDIKVTWYDTKGLLEIMRAWRALVWSPATGLSVARDYKRRSKISQYLPHNSGIDPIREYELVNSWPSVIRHGELTYTESEINLVEVTITYDWAHDPTPN